MSFPRFMYASSEEDADLLYATQFFVPDAFLWWEFKKKSSIVLSPLEIGRGRKEANADRVYAFRDFLKEGVKPTAEHLILAIVKRFGFPGIEVPPHFPAGIVESLRKSKLKVIVSAGSFMEQRRWKKANEVKKIQYGVELAAVGLARGEEVLKQSKIRRDRKLYWGNGVLTSERLRGEIDAAIVRVNGLPANTIVAGGNQACDPHERGSGVLKAHEAIILDIFPRDSKTGYFGDLTRTFVKGRPSDPLRHLYETVKEGKAWVMKQVRPGQSGKQIHQALVDRFAKAGYPTEERKGKWFGFFHGIGHGLGLQVHEAPRFSDTDFQVGEVITIEPGIYYPGLGGVRLEDVVVVTPTGIRNLTRLPEVFEIKN